MTAAVAPKRLERTRADLSEFLRLRRELFDFIKKAEGSDAE